MIQFIFNSLSSYDNFGIIAKTVNRPLLPAKRRSGVVIPGRHGTYDFSDDSYENVIIPVLIQYDNETFEDARIRARRISAWLGQKGASKPLIITDEPDKYYSAKIYDSASVQNIVNLAPGESTTINFECYPLAFSLTADSLGLRIIEPQIVQNNGTEKALPIITITPITLSAGMDEAVEVTGAFPNAPLDLETPQEWPPAIVTTLTNPAITIGGNTLVYTGTLTEGQSLIINTETYQATKGGTNVLASISGEWPVLEVGDNEISIADTTSEIGAAIELLFRKRWL